MWLPDQTPSPAPMIASSCLRAWSAAAPSLVPGARPVEKPVPQGDPFDTLHIQHPRLQLGVGASARRHAGAGIDRHALGLIGQPATRFEEEAAGLLDIPPHPARPRGAVAVSRRNLRSPAAAAAISDGCRGNAVNSTMTTCARDS